MDFGEISAQIRPNSAGFGPILAPPSGAREILIFRPWSGPAGPGQKVAVQETQIELSGWTLAGLVKLLKFGHF